jgi:phosphatidylglycerol:prolipoprotein diacylglycerol transferase
VPPGAAFLAAALGYAVIRFSLSFFRQEALVLWGLQQAQVLALATGLAVGVLLLVRWYVARQVAPLAEPGTGMHA